MRRAISWDLLASGHVIEYDQDGSFELVKADMIWIGHFSQLRQNNYDLYGSFELVEGYDLDRSFELV